MVDRREFIKTSALGLAAAALGAGVAPSAYADQSPARLCWDRPEIVCASWGQSNGRGAESSAALPEEYLDMPGNLVYYQALKPIRSYLQLGYFGPEVAAQRLICAACPDKQVIWIKWCLPRTNLFRDWRRKKAPAAGEKNLYFDFLGYVQAACLAAGIAPRLDLLCGIQGENDALDLGMAESYGQNLVDLVQGWRTELESPEMRYVHAQTWRPDGYPHLVSQRQKEAAALLTRADLVQTLDLPKRSDNLHFNVAGTLRLGERLAARGLALLGVQG